MSRSACARAPCTPCWGRTVPARAPSSSAWWATTSPTTARCWWVGREQAINSPVVARDLGIGMVYQHFTVVPGMTVAENLLLARGRLPAVVPWKRVRAELDAFFEDHSIPAGSGCHTDGPLGRRKAEAGDTQAALLEAALADPRRAHFGAHATGSRRGAGRVARARSCR